MSRDLHRADVVFCVFDGRPTPAAHQQVFLEHRRVGSAQRIHDVGFGDHTQLGRAAIAINKHASYYGDNGAGSNRTEGSRWCHAAHDLAIQDHVLPSRALAGDSLLSDNLCRYLLVSGL